MTPQRDDTSAGPAVAVLPAGRDPYLVDAVVAGGGRVVDPGAAEALVWTDHRDPEGLSAVLDGHPRLRWVQLPWAGIEPYADVVRAHAERTWTCGKGVYADPVAEHALALALAGLRGLDRFARARTWTEGRGRNLIGAPVTIVGGGGIARSLLHLLAPFRCDVTVVRRSPGPVDGARRVVVPRPPRRGAGRRGARRPGAAAGARDRRVDRRTPSRAPRSGRLPRERRAGRHVVTDDLVAALRDGTLGSAGLDVTDPEPLPDGHPLWDLPNAIVTPHTANTEEMAEPLLAERVTDNVRRWAVGEPLTGPVDPAQGY